MYSGYRVILGQKTKNIVFLSLARPFLMSQRLELSRSVSHRNQQKIGMRRVEAAALLNLSEIDPTPQELKSAYIEQAKKYHPDNKVSSL